MSDFFDKIISEVSKSVENVSASSKILIEKAKLNAYISKLEGEKKKLAEKLGVKVYKLYMDDMIAKEEVEEICSEITKKIEMISEQKKNLEEFDKAKDPFYSNTQDDGIVCSCGSDNQTDSKFCRICGNAL